LDLEGWGGGNDVYVRQTTASHTVQFAVGGVDSKAPKISAGNSSNTIGDAPSGYFSGTWENQGTWTSAANGVLTFGGGTLLNDGANVDGGGTITGGTISVASGVLFTQNGNFTFDSVTVAGAGAVLETNGGTTSLFVRNGLTVNGTLDIGDTAGTYYAFLRASN